MRLYFKQRIFSWLDSYDIYDEAGNTVYTVEGKLSWGHKLEISDASGRYRGTVQERVLTFLPQFELYEGETYLGCIRKEFTLFRPSFTLDFRNWTVDGNWLEWDYEIRDGAGQTVAEISKEVLHWSDTYVLDVKRPEDALYVLMVALAIDAEKCSRN